MKFEAAGDVKMLVNGGEKEFVVKVREDVAAILQELSDHWVISIDPFEDDNGIERAQPADDIFEPESGGDHEVVQDSEGEDELRLRAVFERAAFCTAPAQIWGGICNVMNERENAVCICGRLCNKGVEETVNGGVISVERRDVAEFGGNAGVGAKIAAEVPGDLWFEAAADFMNKGRFDGVIRGHVRSSLLVVGPNRVFGLPCKFGDDFFQPGEVVEDHLFTEAGVIE